MLTCHLNSSRLPNNNTAYCAFRLSLRLTLCLMEDEHLTPNDPSGYLAYVPFLRQVPPAVQVDLLGEVWKRHQSRRCIQATLLDAAIVYAACEMTANTIEDDAKFARIFFKHGPRTVRPQPPDRIRNLFLRFWDDIDFLTVEHWQDLPPDQARALKQFMRLSDEEIEPLYKALERGRASPNVLSNLKGLLTKQEALHSATLLRTKHTTGWPFSPRRQNAVDRTSDL